MTDQEFAVQVINRTLEKLASVEEWTLDDQAMIEFLLNEHCLDNCEAIYNKLIEVIR